MNRREQALLAICVLALSAGGCASAGSPVGDQVAASRPAATSSLAPGPATRTAVVPPSKAASQVGGSLRLLAEPRAGMESIYRLIAAARSSIDLTMYELVDPAAEADLAADASRGVNVRVILDRHLEQSANLPAYGYLSAHGVHVRWGPRDTTIHQKTLTVDNGTSVIMTLNFVASDYPDTRDFAVIDIRRADVAAIVATFDADFAGRAITPPEGDDLVWSPTNAQSAVLSVISSARATLIVEDEEMADPAVITALADAARSGVEVKLIMTADPEWDSALSELVGAGVQIRLYPDDDQALYIHAKLIVADAGRTGQQALIGSQNFSVASLNYNRELGILTRDRAIVAAASKVLGADYAGGTAYEHAEPASARCSVTATIYDAARDENNVYVSSNQPYTEATASADGYSHSYETDGSGHALIYLNGPPPGAAITVTVGLATCSTSD
jgi:cardiolipin synthase A/B